MDLSNVSTTVFLLMHMEITNNIPVIGWKGYTFFIFILFVFYIDYNLQQNKVSSDKDKNLKQNKTKQNKKNISESIYVLLTSCISTNKKNHLVN